MLESFKKGRGIQRLLDYIFYQVAAINGFDSFGHYLRARLILNTCSRYYTRAGRRLLEPASPPAPRSRRRARAPRRPASTDPILQRTSAALAGQGPRHGAPATAAAEGRRRRDAAGTPGPPSARPRLVKPATGRTPATPRADANANARARPSSTTSSGRTAMRSRGSSIAGNPVLIGAATVLVVIVAMFLSYNANAGLPFVPTYQLKVEAPSAAALVKGNEVRIGGARVGAVDTITTQAARGRHERRASSA